MKAISGKALYSENNSVVLCIDRLRDEYYIKRFSSETEARAYYNNVNIDKDRYLIRKMKFMLCKHRDKSDVVISKGRYKYNLCNDCGYATYQSLMTDEEIQLRRKEMHIEMTQYSINEMKEQILNLEDAVKKEEKALHEMKEGLSSFTSGEESGYAKS